MFRLLAKMRKLRGTRLDLFGMTAERKMERALIGEFEAHVGPVVANAGPPLMLHTLPTS